MQNVKAPAFISIAQELFAGLYTEATPESLPQGAAPLCINCEFEIGSVFIRPGKQPVYYYADFFETHLPAHAESDPGAFAPNETAWIHPGNVTLNIPGTYASVELNHSGGGGSVSSHIDFVESLSALASNISLGGTITPLFDDLVIYWQIGEGRFGAVTSQTGLPATINNVLPGYNTFPGTQVAQYGVVPAGTAMSISATAVGNAHYPFCEGAMLALPTNGLTPVITHVAGASGGFGAPQVITTGLGHVSSNVTLMACFICALITTSDLPTLGNLTDNSGNTWELISFTEVQGFYAPDLAHYGGMIALYLCIDPAPVPTNIYQAGLPEFGSGVLAAASLQIYEITNLTAFPTLPHAEVLLTNNYNFNIPSTQGILGFEVLVTGHQTSSDPSAIVSVFLNAADNPTLDSPTLSKQLPASDGTVVFGTPTLNWGLDLTNDVLNNPNFGVSLLPSVDAGIDTSWFISAVQLKVYLTPDPAPNVNYIKTFTETGGEILTLALLSSGTMMQEDVLNNEGVLTAVYTAIEPDSFAQSATVDDREFIAISDLRKGTDIPYTYTPPNFDRLSQVGPGAKPSVSTTHTTTGIAIDSITQAVATEIRRISWGAGPDVMNNSTAGNILWVFGEGRTVPPGDIYTTLPNVKPPNSKVWLSGIGVPFPKKSSGSFPYDLNSVTAGAYDIQSVTTGIVGGNETCPLFTLIAPATEYGYSEDFGQGGLPLSGWFYQSTLATIQLHAPIPNLAVGGSIQITGTGGAPPAGYDGTWTTLSSPNTTTMEITQSHMVNGNLTFDYIVTNAGPAPVPLQLVTISGTNGGNGTYNRANMQITAVTPSQFTVVLTGQGIPLNAGPDDETPTGSGQIFGTTFTFEPGTLVGPKLGMGVVVQQGLITAGQRKVCYSFLTRNGFMTQPSPIETVFVTGGAGALAVSNLLTGPENVIARIVHFTPTNGANFYNIPEPVTVINNGIPEVNDSTWVNDNTTTTATFSFSDGVLLTGEQIDIEGNNLFECAELGACVMLVPYSNRVFAVGEQNYVSNFLNLSFDGGIIGGYPAGWTPDSVFATGGSVVASPIFGSAYQIQNTSGITQAAYGMIEQGAFQDEFNVAIINPSTNYSVRVTCSVPSGAASGNLVVDLINFKDGVVVGQFVKPLHDITSSMTIYTGTLLLSQDGTKPGLAPVPELLMLRLWAQNIPNGVTVLIDRVQPFPTEQPNLSQQVTGSYANNFESFDQLTGVILGTNINQQPIVSAFVLSGDALYLVKTGSIIAVADNNTTEPDNWPKPRSISASVGASGPYAVTTGIDEPNSGEDWAIIAGRSGGYIFNGGQPIKLTEEIQAVWNQINWAAGYCIWVKNDITNRRILFGVPLNEKFEGDFVSWLPAGLLENPTNPTTPNAIIELNYKQLNTAGQLAESAEVHRSYSGKLLASEIVRKFSIWIVKSPCAAFIERANGTAPLFLGNSDHTGKIYDLIEGLLEDDGIAIDQIYDTSAFVGTQEGQGSQMGAARMNYDYALILLDGSGTVVITVYPNTLDGPFSHILLPNLTLPASNNGDVELPVNECASRLFMQFRCNAVGSGFVLSRIVMAMHADPWSPVRGRNN